MKTIKEKQKLAFEDPAAVNRTSATVLLILLGIYPLVKTIMTVSEGRPPDWPMIIISTLAILLFIPVVALFTTTKITLDKDQCKLFVQEMALFVRTDKSFELKDIVQTKIETMGNYSTLFVVLKSGVDVPLIALRPSLHTTLKAMEMEICRFLNLPSH